MDNNKTMDDGFKFDSPPASLPQKLEADAELIAWVTQLGGGLNPAVEIHRDAEKGACLRVRSHGELDTMALVARCPISATISIINVMNLDPELPPHDFPCSDRLSQSTRTSIILAFFVAHHQLKGKDSHWWPYLVTLPRASELSSVLFYQGEDLEWLQGTNLYNASQVHHDTLKTEYDSAISILRDEGYPFADSFSWELFSWAYTILASRAFTSRVLQTYLSKNPALRQDEEFQVLLPLVDSSNHKPLAKIEWRAEATEVGLKVIDPVAAEEEIHNNYGPLNNQQLMTTYGFCAIDNPCDFRDLNVHAPPGTPLANARQFRYQEFYEPHGNSLEDKCFLFNIFYPLSSEVSTVEERVFSPGLLDALALTRVTTRESQNIEVTEDRTYANLRDSGSRVSLNALCQGSVELAFRIIRIRRGGYLERQPQNDKQRAAQIYRQSEWSVYMTGLTICEWAIARARLQDADVLEARLKEYLSYIPRLQVRERLEEIIRGSGSIVEQRSELFHGYEVLGLINSSDMKETVGDFIKEISNGVDEAISPSDRIFRSEILMYSIFILVCVAANEAKKNPLKHTDVSSNGLADLLPKRLEVYTDKLAGWYQVGSPQAAWEDMDEDLESEIGTMYKAVMEAKSTRPNLFMLLEGIIGPSNEWLSEAMLRWAVYVVQEEQVTILQNPLEMVSKESVDQPVRMVTNSYFYLPQLPESEQ
ncbi:hypothetical protein FQN49_001318 [Arthroderma sp. PD_2]|nr:hypothetical protein FQN49_001318 [Arthroderma sp. PD_2]